MNRFNFSKRKVYLFITIIIVFVLSIISSFAGHLITINDSLSYQIDDESIAKNVWVWIDDNNDAIAECYRFDKDGKLAINYRDRYGKATNEKGQLIEDGVVVKKYLSSGKILNYKSTPANEVKGQVIETIDPSLIVLKDKWTGKEKKVKVSETNSITETIDGKIIGSDVKEEIDILNGETAESGIIFVGPKASKIGDNVRVESEVIAGKDLRRYITYKYKCREKEEDAYIYGGKKWNDVISLNGDGSYVKIDLKENNYIYFELAHQNHRDDTEYMEDTEMKLEMYIDGELHSSYEDFLDEEPEIVEETFERGKEIELRVRIIKGAKGRKVYIRNGRLKKVNVKE